MIDPILTAIEKANLPANEYRAARRLLDRLPYAHDVLIVEQADAIEICGVQTWGAARRLLVGLNKAGIMVHCNSRAVIQFLHCAEKAAGRAGEDPNRAETARLDADARAETDHSRAETARLDADARAETDHSRAETARLDTKADHSRADSPLPLSKLPASKQVSKDTPTYLPTLTGAGAQPPLTDQERSLALLTDPAVGAFGKLLDLAGAYPFRQIRLQVFHTLRLKEDPASKVTSIAVIAHRLKVGSPAFITDADRASALWLRHETEQERQEERQRRYGLDGLTDAERFTAWGDEPEPDFIPDPASEPEAMDPALAAAAAQWAQLQAEFALQHATGSADGVIQDAWVIAQDGPAWTIGIADAFRYDWVVKKLGRQIQRKLAVIAGQPVTVEFQVRPRTL